MVLFKKKSLQEDKPWFSLKRSLPEDKRWFSSAFFLVHHLRPVVLVQLHLYDHCCDHHYHHYRYHHYFFPPHFHQHPQQQHHHYHLFCLTSKNLGMLRAKETMVTGTVYTSNRFVLLIAFKRNKYNCTYMTLHVYMTLHGTSTAQKVMICNFHIEEVLG